jgi:iron complex outermembrane receptor protein
MEVIEGDQLRKQSISSLADAFNGTVPGMWVWEGSPSSLVAQYGALRGASSFGTTAPKIYIDGVEVANPLLVMQLDPDVVDHIEVIRGPQGSALYGSDAISGVVNVLTRHDAVPATGSRVHLSSTAGATNSAFGAALVPTHEQRGAVRFGSNLQSGGIAADFGQSGGITPSADTRHLLLAGDARFVGSGATLTTTARYYTKHAGAGPNPLLAISPSNLASSSTSYRATPSAVNDTAQSVRQYTLGATSVIAGGGRWTHTVLAGIDGYRLDHVADATTPFPSTVDSALRAARGSADRATMRASTVARLGDDGGDLASSLTLGLEHSVLRQVSLVNAVVAPQATQQYGTAQDARVESWNHNTGVLSQLDMAWRDRVFVSGGVRLERNDAFSGSERYPLLPLVGVALVQPVGGAELKLRTAYGKGIRPPLTPARVVAYAEQRRQDLPTALDPEVQSGFETGLELYVGHVLSMQVTRFDQVASGLIQNVAVGVDTIMQNGMQQRRVRYQLQNIGEIGNHGWELQSTLRTGPFAVATALTLVDSRVRAVAPHYYGDLRPGDRLLAVPARTGSLTASWTGTSWFAAITATRAADWVNYDRLALARAYTSPDGPAPRNLVGPHLRAYWRSYDGDTHLRLTTTRDIGRGVGLVLTGDNLLGGQLGEPDNVTIRPGRTLSGGLRADF